MTRSRFASTLAVLSLLLGGTAAISVQAQDSTDSHRDQPTEQSRGDQQRDPSEERRTPTDERRGPTEERRAPAEAQRGPSEDRRAAGDEQRGLSEERRAPADENRDRGGDDVATLHRAHPHSAARCHDGFFTSTRDRGHACSKHGGIDIWLL